MRDKHLAAVTAALLVVVAATVALTAGGQRATSQATTQDQRSDATGVTLRGVTVERLQLQNTTIENATVGRLTIDRLSSDERTIRNGTFVDVEISSLELPGVTADELGGGPPASPGAPDQTTTGTAEETTMGTPEETTMGTPEETTMGTPEETTMGTPEETTMGTPEETTTGATTPAAAPASNGQMAQQGSNADIGSLRIATLSVEQATVGSVTFETTNASGEQAPAGTPSGAETPMEPGTTESPMEPGTTESPMEPGTTESPMEPGTTESPMEPGTTESPMEPGTATESGTPAGAETPGATPGTTPTGSPVFDLQNQAGGPQGTPGGDDTGQGQSVAVQHVNVSQLTVDEMVLTVAVPRASPAMPTAQPTPSMPANATEAGGTPAAEPGTQGSPSGGMDGEEMPAADVTVARLDVESASASSVSARLTDSYGQFHVTNVSAPEQVQVGENYTVSFTVVNADDERNVEYVGYRLGPAIPSRQLLVLDPGEHREITVNVTTGDLAPGSYAQAVETKESSVVQTVTVTNETEMGTPGTNETETPMESGTETPTDGVTPETETTAGETPETGVGTETGTETETGTSGMETTAPGNVTTVGGI